MIYQHKQRWWDVSPLRDYNSILKFFNSCRNKTKGKPLASWGRVYEEGGKLLLYFGERPNGVQFAELTPDNILTFTIEPHLVRQVCAHTFSSSLYRAIPFMWQRVGTARYRIQHTSKIPSRDEKRGDFTVPYMEWSYMSSKAPEYFKGMQFNMLTGECINRRPDLNASVNPSQRKVWLGALRKFKYGMKARARVGSLSPMIQAELGVRNNRMTPDWSDPMWSELLYTSIKNTDYPMELLRGFVAHAVHNNWWLHKGSMESISVIDAVDEVCNTYSIDLRRRFGVFDEVSTMQEKNEVSRHEVAGDREDNHTQMEV